MTINHLKAENINRDCHHSIATLFNSLFTQIDWLICFIGP